MRNEENYNKGGSITSLVREMVRGERWLKGSMNDFVCFTK